MNDLVRIAQNTATPLGKKIIMLSRPADSTPIVIRVDSDTVLNLTTISNENIVLVRAGDRLIVMFADRSSIVLSGFYGPDNQPINGLEIELGQSSPIPALRLSGILPISEDLSILPASGAASAGGGTSSSLSSLDSGTAQASTSELSGGARNTNGNGTAGASNTDTSFSTSSTDTASQANGADGRTTLGGFLTGAVVEDATGTATANLTINAPGTQKFFFAVQSITNGTYGTFSLSAAGVWTYRLDNSRSVVQALAAGQVVTDTFTAVAGDGTISEDVTITINGTNDVPVVANAATQLAGTVVEAGHLDNGTAVAGTVSISGLLSATDVDADATQTWSIQGTPSTTYGSLALTDATRKTGGWTYTLDNALTATQALKEGQTVTETYTVRVTDDFGAYVDQTVTITINGTNDVPVVANAATQLAGTVVEAGHLDNGTASISGLLSATDVDADATQTWSIQGTPSTTYGSLALTDATRKTGGWTYTLDNALTATQALKEGQTVTETYTVRVTDDFGAYVDQTVTITINGTNDVPVVANAATQLAGTVVEAGHLDNGTAVAGTVSISGLLSATDVDADATQTWSIQGTPSTTYGSLALTDATRKTGGWTYTLDNALTATQALKEGQTVTETYTVRVTDDFGAYVDQTVTITINGTNDVPVVANAATQLAGTVVEAGHLDNGTAVAGTVSISGLLSATDVDADATQTWSIQGTPSTTYGSLALTDATRKTGGWTYTLDNALTATQALKEGQTVTETYTVRVTDDFGAYVDQTVTITINGTNDVPVVANAATQLAGTVVEAGHLDNGTASISGLLSATDVDADATQTWSIQGTPSTTYGSLALTDATRKTGGWTYTLDNALTATQALKEGQTVTETYTVRVTDDFGAYVDQTVTITINGTNDVPVVANAATQLAGTVVEAGHLDNGTAVAGTVSISGLLSATDVDADATQTWSIQGTPSTTYGSLALTDATRKTGGWTYTLDNALTATQALKEGQTVTETYTVRVTDDFGAYVDQTVTITINGTNDVPVVANAATQLAGTVVEAGHLDNGTAVAGTASISGLLSATDVDADATQTWSIQGTPSTTYGSLALTDATRKTGGWTYTLDNALTATQALKEGQTVTETYTVRVTDDFGAYVDQTVTITINGTNDVPVVANAATQLAGTVVEAGHLDNGTAVAGTVSISGLLSATDVDADATQTWSIQGTPSTTYGSLALTDATRKTGGWTYTLDNALTATQALKEGQTVTETYTVRVTDDFGAYVDQTVTITINGTNDVPVVANAATQLAGTVVEAGHLDNGTASISGLLSATDVDADATQTWSIQGTPSTTYGSLALTDATRKTGGWTYTLDNALTATQALKEGQTVTETYTVRVTDDFGAYVDQTVTITINGTNDVPVVANAATQLAGTVVEAGHLDNGTAVAGTVSISGLLSATDVDADATQTWSIQGTPSTTYGSLALTDATRKTGGWTYTLDNALTATQALKEGQTVTETYTVRVTDDFGAYVDQTVTITINGTNDVPVVANAATQLAGTVVEAGHLDNGTAVAGTASISGLLSATDVDADATQTWSIQGTPSTTYGSLALTDATRKTGGWTYTLDNALTATQALKEGQTVTETYTVRVTDDFGAYVDQTVTITINGTNDVPVVANAATQLAGTVVEAGHLDNGTAVAGTVSISGLLSATDVDADATQTWSIQGTPSTTYGSLALTDATRKTGGWTYTLDNALTATQALKEGQTVTETYTVRVTDDFGAYVDQTVTITINGTNDVPVVANAATQLAGTVVEAGHLDNGTAVAGTVSISGLLSATDVDADATQTWSIQGTPSTTYGSLALTDATRKTGGWTYTLDNALTATQALKEGQTVTETYTVRVTDDFGAYVDQTVTITINGTNDVPVVANAATQLAGTVVEAGHLDNGTAVAGTASISGLLSATDVDADATQTWSIQGTPSTTYGSLALTDATRKTGGWTYTLDNALTATQALKEGQTVTETYTVRVTDDFGAYVDQTVTITINGTNDVPVVANAATQLAGTVVEAGHLDNGTAVAGTVSISGLLSATDVDADATQTWSIQGTPSTTYGSLALTDATRKTGGWTYTLDNALTATQALKEGQTVTETYTVRVTDDFGAYVDQTVTITINGTNDVPVVANAATQLAGTVVEAGHLDNGTASISGLLSATDVDADATQTWSIQGTPSTTYGSLALTDATRKTGGWTYTLDNALTATQALKEGQTVTETYTVRVTDDFGAYVDQTVTITINGTNDVPVVVADVYAGAAVVEAGAGVIGQPTATGNVLTNDTDVDAGDTKTVTTTGSLTGTYGTLVLNADGSYTYTLDDTKAATEALTQGQQVSEVFNYTMKDTAGATSSSTLTIAVTGTNDAPVASATAETASGNEDTTITGTLLAGSDVDSTSLTYQIVANSATNGTVTLTNAATGAYNFTPTANYNGPASFQYRISDGTATSTVKTVNLTVNAVNDAPVATGETLTSVKEDSGMRVISFASLLDNDTAGPANESGQTLTITGLSNIVGGTAVINGTNVEFTPAANFNGTASFSYTIQDNGQSAGVNDFKTATAAASFSVTAVPDAPVGTATTITATEDTPRAFTAADFGFTDPNDTPANTFSGVVITTLPSAGTLTNNGVAVTAGNAITIADINASRLVFTPAANANGSAYSSFTFQVQDNATLSGTSVNTNGLITGWTGTNTVTLIQGPTSAADQTVFAGAQNVGAPNAVIKTDIANQPLAIATTGSQYHLAFDFLNLVGYGAAPLTVQVFAGTTLIGSKSQAKLTTFPSLISLSLDTSAVSAADNGKAINIVWSAGGGHGDLIAIDNVALTQIGGNGSNLLVNGDFGSGSYYVGANTDTTPRTMTIDVTPVNDAPVAVADVYVGTAVVEAGNGVTGQPTATGNVLTNDTDVDAGDTKTVTNAGTIAGTYGNLVLNADGSYTYTLDNTKPATDALVTGQQVNEVFNYTMKDTSGLTSSSTLTIGITGSDDNTAPVAQNDSASLGSIGVETRVNTYTANDQINSKVAALKDGGYVVTWQSNLEDGSEYGVYGQRYAADGAASGTEFRVNTYTGQDQTLPSVTGLVDGGFVVTWVSWFQDGSLYGIFAQRYNANGTRSGTEFRVNSYTDGIQSNPSVTALNDGGYVVTWHSYGQDGSSYGIFGQRYASTGAVYGPEFQINTFSNSDQTYPVVTPLNDGGFVVVWASVGPDGDAGSIQGQRYSANGTPSGTEFRINSYTPSNQDAPSVTGLTDGGFVVTWVSYLQDGSGYGVYGQRYSANGTASGAEFRVNSFTSSDQGSPTITALTDGGYVVTWMSNGQDGNQWGIYGQRYDANGVASGTEFRINSTTNLSQQKPSVTGLADGTFVVTWESQGQDGDGYGIYSQRFSTTISTNEDTSKLVLAGTLLANDADANNDALSITAVSATSAKGAAVSVVGGNVLYDPAGVAAFQALGAGQNTTDTFTYTISDGKGGTSTAAVTMTVTGVNDGPVAVADLYSGPAVVEIGAGIAGQPTATGNVLNNDTDVDSGDTKTVTTPGTLNGTYGDLVLGADGAYTYTLVDTRTATQALRQGQQVNEVFNYTIVDSAGTTSSSSLTVTITGANDVPVGANITYALSEDALRSAYLNLSATDPDSTSFTFSNVRQISGPDVRTAPGVNPNDGNPRTFDLVVWDNYNYLAAGETEQAVYSYDVSDGQATGTGSVTITITGVNDAPIAVADTYAGDVVIEAGGASAGQPTASGNVLTNDTDVDRVDTKTVTNPGTIAGTYGSLVLGADGSYTYTLDNAKPATQALAQGAQVNETFNYTMRDTSGATSSSTLTIGITGTNDAAVIGTPTVSTVTEDTAITSGNLVATGTISISDVDTGQASFSTTVTGVNSPWGTLTLAANGAYTYTVSNSDSRVQALNSGQTRVDTFRVTSADGTTKDVSFTINGQNEPVLNTAPQLPTGDGKVVSALTTNNDRIIGLVAQSDGKIVVSGFASPSLAMDFAIARYNADGSLDTTFNGTGYNIVDVAGPQDAGYRVVVQSDGKYIVAGQADSASTDDFALVRFNANGTLDTTFGTGGKVVTQTTANTDQAREAVVQTDGKIIVVGHYGDNTNQSKDVSLVRYTSSGTLDSTFGTNGRVITPVGSGTANDEGRAVELLADGKILVGGFTFNGTDNDFMMLRYNSNGTLDTTFGTNGITRIAVGPGNDLSYDFVVQSDGKIVMGGFGSNGSNNDFEAVRLNADGSLDTSFGTAGKVMVPMGTNDSSYGITLQADGKIILSGYTNSGGTNDIVVARLTTTGALDSTFGTGGKVVLSNPSTDDYNFAATVQLDGKILLAGSVINAGNEDYLLIRLNSDGSIDTTFDVANSLGGYVNYTENAAPLVLDSSVSFSDAELTAANNYDGATLTLARFGGANAQDVFSASGTLGTLTQGAALTLGGTNVGTVTTNSNGTLALTFASGTTQAQVNSVAQQIAYANASDAPPACIAITWTFADGNTGAQGVGNNLSVSGTSTVVITAVNDAPVLSAVSAFSYTDTANDDTFSSFNGTLSRTDPDTGDTASYSIVGGTGTGGSVSGSFGTMIFTTSLVGSYGTLYMNGSSGVYRYIPSDAAIEGTTTSVSDSFSLRVTDSGGATDTKTLAVNITGANDTPSFGGTATGSVTEDSAVNASGQLTASGTMTVTDRDANQSTFQATTYLGTQGGSLVLNAVGAWTYTIPNGLTAVQNLNQGQSIVDNITVRSADGTTKVVSITINGVNEVNVETSDAPAGITSTYRIAVGGTATGTISASFDQDWFGVNLIAGTSYQVDLKGSPSSKGTLSDPYFYGLYSSNGTFIGFSNDDESGPNLESRSSFTVATSGLYYLSAGAYSANIGSYTLYIRAGTFSDPIVLDLDGDGVDLSATTTFDIDADGVRDRIGWVGANDGVLAMDLDGSGTINDGSELFSDVFNQQTYANSLKALASLDSDGDGVIDTKDAAYSKILVWQDTNGNGISDEGELTTLAQRGIASINLLTKDVDMTVDGQKVFAHGSFTLTSGETRDYLGVVFQSSDTDNLTSTKTNPTPSSTEATNGNGTDGAQSHPIKTSLSLVASSRSGEVLTGGDANDSLTAGPGADRLTGGEGKDEFRYNAMTEGGDTILDFTSASDKIAILNSLVGTAGTGTLDAAGKLGGTGAVLFESVNGNVAGINASANLIFNTANHDLYFDNDGGNTTSGRTLLAHLENGANIAATDIKIVV